VQFEQVERPVVVATWPTGQREHTVEPCALVKVPMALGTVDE